MRDQLLNIGHAFTDATFIIAVIAGLTKIGSP
jgi:hypothetical protein